MKSESGASSKGWKRRIEASRKERKTLVDGPWKDNVAYRKLKPFGAASDIDRVAVPIDWSFSKAKIATLYSQTPQVQLTPKHPRYAPAVPVFSKELNHVLQQEARVGVAIEEALADAVNASGIAGVKVGYLATFEDVQVPAIDMARFPPELHEQLLASGRIPMKTVQRPVSEKFYANRISPANLLWDTTFKGSDFDDSAWIGWEGSLTWAEAKREFKLTDEQKQEVLGAGKLESLGDEDGDQDSDEATVTFQEIFYKSHIFNADELYFERIKRIVFIDGIEKPVVHEDLEWQEFDEATGTYIGVCQFPIRVLTLTYISDTAVPPSDSEVGRPQVDETMRSRSQMIQQRDHSMPLRTANTNRIDPMVLDQINKGTWQGIIPVNGDASAVINEVARANYPQERWEFDRVTRTDLQEAWQVGANQTGQFASGERSASEASIVQQNFSTRIGVERGKVGKFFCGIAEVLAGLMQLYYDKPNELPLVGEDGVQRIDQAWDRSKVSGAKFVFTITPDSTVLLDATQKVDRLMKFINLTGKSGFVNVEPIIAEIAALSGLDPAQVMTKPNPPAPEQPNFSYRYSGAADLHDPIVMAMLIKSGQAPGPEEMKAAKQLIADAQTLPALPDVTSAPVPQAALPPAPPQQQQPDLDDWQAMPRVTKRVDELGG